METMYRTIIGAANKSMFGMSAVGDKTAAEIMMLLARRQADAQYRAAMGGLDSCERVLR